MTSTQVVAWFGFAGLEPIIQFADRFDPRLGRATERFWRDDRQIQLVGRAFKTVAQGDHFWRRIGASEPKKGSCRSAEQRPVTGALNLRPLCLASIKLPLSL